MHTSVAQALEAPQNVHAYVRGAGSRSSRSSRSRSPSPSGHPRVYNRPPRGYYGGYGSYDRAQVCSVQVGTQFPDSFAQRCGLVQLQPLTTRYMASSCCCCICSPEHVTFCIVFGAQGGMGYAGEPGYGMRGRGRGRGEPTLQVLPLGGC